MARNSTKARRLCIERHAYDRDDVSLMRCHCGCDVEFDPSTTAWRADHNILHSSGGKEVADNLYPIRVKCDLEWKAADDNREAKKATRIMEKNLGIRRPKGRPMPGSRASGIKKKMDGSVERR